MTTCGTGGWTGPLPGDPDNNVILSASAGFGGVRVSWSFPSTYPWAVAYIIVFRATVSTFSSSIEIAKVNSSFYFDPNTTGVDTGYFYWIQVVSVNGTFNDVVGPATAISRPSVAQVIEGLTDAIDLGKLAPTLKDKITEFNLLGGSISDEIAARLAAQDALGLTIDGLSGDVTNALTVIETQNLQRIADNTAMAAQLTLVAAGLEDSIAGVAEEFTAFASPSGALATWKAATEITLNGNIATGAIGLVAEAAEHDGKITNIGARYTALVTVNGLVGGFGVYNDGTSVEAGFDVDKFWIGRTAANKRKPFIVVGGVVYIDQAVINELTFTKLIDATGGTLVASGKIKTDYIETKGLLIRDMLGNVLFGAGNALDFSNVGGTTKPADGATRNVYRGAWLTATAYAIGDSVIDGGYGWVAKAAHTSSGVIKPPTYPTASNAYWALSTVKGDSGVNTAMVYAYRRSGTALGATASPGDTADTGTGASSFVFSTRTLTLPAGTAWSATIPAGTAALYVSTAIAASNTDTDSIPASEWTNPVILVSNGTDGLPGTAGVRGTRALYDVNAAAGAAGYNSLSTYTFGANAAGSASYAAKATDLIATATSGSTPTTPLKGDTVTFSNGTNFVNTLTYTGAAWAAPGVVVDGGLLVTGTVTADKINSNGLTIRDASGNVLFSSAVKLGAASLATGLDYAPQLAWNFQASALNSFLFYQSTFVGSAQYATLTATTADPQLHSPVIALAGGTYDKVRMRLKRTAGTVWDGSLFYFTSGHGESSSYVKVIPWPTGVGLNEWVVLEWDMADLTVGGTDWVTNTIIGLRFDLGGVTGDAFQIDWISVGRYGPLQINASNISTFIASASIQSAQIGNLQVKSANIEELTVGTSKITANAVTNSSGNVTTAAFDQTSWGAVGSHLSPLDTGWVDATIGSVLVTVNLLVRESSFSSVSENDSVTTVYPVDIYVFRVSGTSPYTWTQVFHETKTYSFTFKDVPGLICNYVIVPVATGGDWGVIKKGSSATVLGIKK